MKVKFVILVLGVVSGAALMHFFGGQARQAVGLEGRVVEANVLEERRDEDGRLVLMLESEGESMLATFRERADDVASLVHVGDVVSFRALADGVFSDDVPLLSVRRGDAVETSEEPEEAETTETAEESPLGEGDVEAEESVGEGDAEEATEERMEEGTEPNEPVPLAENAESTAGADAAGADSDRAES